MKKLSQKQKNQLLTGKSLAMEIPASSQDCRAFLIVGSYRERGGWRTEVGKFLNEDKSDVVFYIVKYEIEKMYLENNWDVAHDELQHFIQISPILSIEDLEKVEKHLDNFSGLQPEWYCDNPL